MPCIFFAYTRIPVGSQKNIIKPLEWVVPQAILPSPCASGTATDRLAKMANPCTAWRLRLLSLCLTTTPLISLPHRPYLHLYHLVFYRLSLLFQVGFFFVCYLLSTYISRKSVRYTPRRRFS